MNRRLHWLMTLGVLFLVGCAQMAPAPQEPEVVDMQQLQARLAQLPGAEMVAGEEPLKVRYPAGSLFTVDSVLPLPGGVGLLSPLADVLKDYPDLQWQVGVSAATERGDDFNRSLAQKRLELVRRYFNKRGLDASGDNFSVDLAAEAPLILSLVGPVQAESSSDGSKE